MKATYTGDPSQPKGTEAIPDSIEVLGVTFEKGKATDIPTELEAKFVGNNHFETSGKETAPAPATATAPAAPSASTSTPAAPADPTVSATGKASTPAATPARK